MHKIVSRKQAMQVAGKALKAGATYEDGVIEWDVSSRCVNPHKITLAGAGKLPPGEGSRPTDTGGHVHPQVQNNLTVKCRTKCPECLKRRGYIWAQSAQKEIVWARRTWFVTLTFRPELQVWARLQAINAYQGDFDLACETVQFRSVVSVLGRDVTKYIKRVRKSLYHKAKHTGLGCALRYMCVAERHKSGNPHFHLLVHEQVGSEDLRYRVLKDHWPHGFMSAKLVDDDQRAAWYAAKYLAKEAGARVRASHGYLINIGEDVQSSLPPQSLADVPCVNRGGSGGRSPPASERSVKLDPSPPLDEVNNKGSLIK